MPPVANPEFDYASDYQGHDHGIAIVGAGAIVEVAHLPAYADAGFDVVGLYDVDAERAETVAAGSSFDLAVYADLDDLLADDAVDVVDIAVPPMYQHDIVERVVDTGRDLLCQKPLSNDFEEAVAIVEAIEDAGVTAAVNQQMRWEKSIRAAKQLIDAGELGTVLAGSIDVNIDIDWTVWDWIVDLRRVEVMFHSIHYLDTMRYLFGEPNLVYSTMARAPGQGIRAETRTRHTLEYDGDVRASVDSAHNNWADGYARFRFEGTDGTVKGTLGLLDNYPEGNPDEFAFRSGPDADWEHHEVETAWFPDAFIGTMGSLLESIETGETAAVTPRDHLETLRLTNATYKSASLHESVDPSTVAENHYVYD